MSGEKNLCSKPIDLVNTSNSEFRSNIDYSNNFSKDQLVQLVEDFAYFCKPGYFVKIFIKNAENIENIKLEISEDSNEDRNRHEDRNYSVFKEYLKSTKDNQNYMISIEQNWRGEQLIGDFLYAPSKEVVDCAKISITLTRQSYSFEPTTPNVKKEFQNDLNFIDIVHLSRISNLNNYAVSCRNTTRTLLIMAYDEETRINRPYLNLENQQLNIFDLYLRQILNIKKGFDDSDNEYVLISTGNGMWRSMFNLDDEPLCVCVDKSKLRKKDKSFLRNFITNKLGLEYLHELVKHEEYGSDDVFYSDSEKENSLINYGDLYQETRNEILEDNYVYDDYTGYEPVPFIREYKPVKYKPALDESYIDEYLENSKFESEYLDFTKFEIFPIDYFSNGVHLTLHNTSYEEYIKYGIFRYDYECESGYDSNEFEFDQFCSALIVKLEKIYSEFMWNVREVNPDISFDDVDPDSLFSSSKSHYQINQPAFFIGTTDFFKGNILDHLSMRELNLLCLKYLGGFYDKEDSNRFIYSDEILEKKANHLFQLLNLQAINSLNINEIRRALDNSILGTEDNPKVLNKLSYSIVVLIKHPIVNVDKFKKKSEDKDLRNVQIAEFNLYPTFYENIKDNNPIENEYSYGSVFVDAHHLIRNTNNESRNLSELSDYELITK